MASLDSILSRSYRATGQSVYAVTDSPVAIRMRYVGKTSATSVTVTTATNVVTVSNEAGTTTTKTYAFATYTTVGAVADAINADGIFEAKVLDVLRSDASASKLVDGAITSSHDGVGNTIWDATVDTSTLKAFYATIGVRDFLGKMLEKTFRPHLQEVKYNVTLGGAGANLVNFYIRKPNGTETKVWTGTSVSATAETINFAAGVGKISGYDGDMIVTQIKDGTSITDAAGNFFVATGIIE